MKSLKNFLRTRRLWVFLLWKRLVNQIFPLLGVFHIIAVCGRDDLSLSSTVSTNALPVPKNGEIKCLPSQPSKRDCCQKLFYNRQSDFVVLYKMSLRCPRRLPEWFPLIQFISAVVIMETIESLDKECSALGGLFQQVINDMKVRNNPKLVGAYLWNKGRVLAARVCP
jgi:hypothetical protein